jgi:PAS domain S-box-containing protein
MNKYVELTLKESELRYRRLFEAAQDGILILDAQTGLIDDVNPYLINQLGYSREEFINKKLWDVGAFKDIEANRIAFETLQEDEFIRYDDLPLKAKNGKLIQVEFVSNVYRVGERKVIQCNIRDITERKIAEKKVNYQANLLESVNDAIMAWNVQHKFTAWNSAAETLYGWKAKELLGLKDYEILNTEWPAVDAPRMKKSIDKTGRWRGEAVQEHKNGSHIAVEVSSLVHRDDKGIISGYSSVNHDITRRKQVNDELKLAYITLSNIYNNLPEAIFKVDIVHNKVLHASPAHEAIFGYSCEVFFKNPQLWYEMVIPEDKANVDQANATLSVVKILKQQFRILRADGNVRWIECIIRPTLDVNGKILYLDGIFSDIHERKLAEQKIEQQLEHLTALRAIDRFIAGNFDLKLSLSEILSHVLHELHVDAADVLLLNSKSQMLEFGAERGFRSQNLRNKKINLHESYAGLIVLERQLIEIQNLHEEPQDILFNTSFSDDNFYCYFGVPLIAKGKLVGVLEIFHRSALKPNTDWYEFLNSLAGQAAIAIDNSSLFDRLQRSNLEIALAYDATIEGWSRALDLRDKETEGHTQRVMEMTLKLVQAFGFTEMESLQIRWGALLHDIGKMGIPDHILHKPGPLTDEEWIVMKHHPMFAYDLIFPIRYLRNALDIPYCHHVKWDGSGYPRGLKGIQIPMVARIFSIVDVWDALSSDRPYRDAWPPEKVNEYLYASSGTQFDPQVVEVFMEMLKHL